MKDESKNPVSILVIDDDPEICKIVSEMLTRKGHRVVAAPDGEKGMALLRQNNYHLVLTEMCMPGMSGWEVARSVKQLNPDTPVIMLTGWNITKDEMVLKTKEVDCVLTKPLDLSQIHELVNGYTTASGVDAGSDGPG